MINYTLLLEVEELKDVSFSAMEVQQAIIHHITSFVEVCRYIIIVA